MQTESPQQQAAKRKRGRPRIWPITVPDPNMPKKPRGRPKKYATEEEKIEARRAKQREYVKQKYQKLRAEMLSKTTDGGK